MIHYIYRIVNNINDKSYIGYTIDPERRWKAHLNIVKWPKRGFVLHDAMRKYGVNNFTMEIVYCSLDANYTLQEMEPYFIKVYNSKIDKNGYNLTDGGESNYGWIPSETTRQKWRTQRKGRLMSESTKEKLRQYTKANPPMHDPLVREKVSKTLKEMGIRPTMTSEQREKHRQKMIGWDRHTAEHKNRLSELFKKSNPMHNLETKEKARRNKIGKGTGAKNGRACFCKIINEFGMEVASGHLATICKERGFPFKKFLKNSRKSTPIERMEYKGWNIIRLYNDCQRCSRFCNAFSTQASIYCSRTDSAASFAFSVASM